MTDIETDAPEAEAAAADPMNDAVLTAAAEAHAAELAEMRDRLLRAAAETENVRRRLEREKGDAAQYAVTAFARDLLTVADNLARAVEAAPSDLRDGAAAGLVEGVAATQRELVRVLERHGVQRIEAIGTALDPNRHQAMLEIESAEAAPGTVVAELQAGYMLKDRLLRPSLVSVAKLAASA